MTTTPAQADSAHPGSPGPRPSIVQVDDACRLEAVQRLVGAGNDKDHARRFIHFAEESGIDLSRMWCRLDDAGRVQASVLAVPNPGRTAMVFATPVRRERNVTPVAEVIDHTCTAMVGSDTVQLAQALLDPGDAMDLRAFRAAGFSQLARLSYLDRTLPGSRVSPVDDWPDGVTVATIGDTRRDDLLAVLAASYEKTLDCPGLVGLRRTEDILAGHRATGSFDPDLWMLLELDGRPAGTLLLNPASQGSCIELVYLGLTLPARGRGLGRRLLRHGLAKIRVRAEERVTLAVDENNTPALSLYRSEGFKRTLRRVAMIRAISA